MSSREQFEAWAEREKLSLAYGDCGYVYSSTEAAWKSWQAASKASEQQLAAVVAENAGLKTYRPQPHGAAMMEALDAFFEHEDVPEQGMMASFEILCCKRPPTPATYAAIAKIQAQGVDAAIEQLIQKFEGTGHIGVPVMVLEHFAAQLRQGAAL